MSWIDPNAAQFEWNPSVSDAGASPDLSSFYQNLPPKVYPASFSYNPPPGINCSLNAEAYFYYFDDKKLYLHDGLGKTFGPFSDYDLHYLRLNCDQEPVEGKTKPDKDEKCISNSDNIKSQGKRINKNRKK